MNIVGIIAEYNPMHNGHLYHIKEAKRLANAEHAIVIMSGSFTEQGNICTLDKFTRAKIAIENGADLVIELPTIYSTSSAEMFAFGAVNILNSLGVVTHLAFGSEASNIKDLETIANVCITQKEDILEKSKEYIKNGFTHPRAYATALTEFLPENLSEETTKPNNILGIEYLKALKLLKSQIKPVLVHRLNSSHSDIKILNTNEYASSTAIRETLNSNSLEIAIDNIKNVVPKNTLDYIKAGNFNTNEKLWPMLKYEILKLNIQGLKNIAEVTEGLENRIYNACINSNSYDEFIFNTKAKRYTLSRIKRICIYIILGITKDLKKHLSDANYIRILKVKKSSKHLLSKIAANTTIPLITKITDETLNKLDSVTSTSIKLDILANNLTGNIQEDYINNILC